MDTKRAMSGNPTSPRKWNQKRIKTESTFEESRLFRPISPLKWHRRKNTNRPIISSPIPFEVIGQFHTPNSSPRPELKSKKSYTPSFTFTHSSIFHEHLSSDSERSREEKDKLFNQSIDSFSKSMEQLKSPTSAATASSSGLNMSIKPLGLPTMPSLEIPQELMLSNHEASAENSDSDEFHDTRSSFRESLGSLHGLTEINNEINNINAQINDINQQIRGISELDKMDVVEPVSRDILKDKDTVNTEDILGELSSLRHEEEDDEEEDVPEEVIGEDNDSLRPLPQPSTMPRLLTTSTLGTLVDDADKKTAAAPRSFATSASARTLIADRFMDPESISESIQVVDISVVESEHAEEEDSQSPLNSSSVIASTPIEVSHCAAQTNLFRTHQDQSKYSETGVIDNRVSLISTSEQYPLDIDWVSPIGSSESEVLPFSLRDVPLETSHRDDYVFENMQNDGSRPVSNHSSSSFPAAPSSADSLGIQIAPPDLLAQPLGFKNVSNNMDAISLSSEDSEEREKFPNLPFGDKSFAELNSGSYQFPELDDQEEHNQLYHQPTEPLSLPETPMSVHSQQFSAPPSLSYSPASLEEPIMHPPRAHIPFVFRSRELDQKDYSLYTNNNSPYLVNHAFIPVYSSPDNSPQFPHINSFPELRGMASKEPPREYLEQKAEREKEIAWLTREYEQKEWAQSLMPPPELFTTPASPLRVRKQRAGRPQINDTPQIPKRSASRKSSNFSGLSIEQAVQFEPKVEFSPNSARQGSTGSSGTVIRHPLQNQFPSLPDNEMLFMTRTGQKQMFGKIHSVTSNPGGTHLYDLEAQRESNACRDSISLLMLFLFFFMPPLWLAMGLGYLDSVAGEIKPSHKKAALALGGTMLVAAVVGISVGLGVGLTRPH